MPKAAPHPARPLPHTRLLPWFLIICTVAVYLNSLPGEFVLDDVHHIVENPKIRQLWPISNHLTGGRATVQLSLAINYAIEGLEPVGYHLWNIVVHTLAGLTLFGVVRRTLSLPKFDNTHIHTAPWFAAVVALLFLIHPLQTQAVTYTIQRAESMVGLFYLAMLYGAVRAWRPADRLPWGLAAVMFCALGMVTKPVMATAPLAVVLYDHVFITQTPREIWRRRWPLYTGLAAGWLLIILSGFVNHITSTRGSAGFGMQSLTWWQYALTQPTVILHYLRLTVWPDPLCIDYAWPPARNALEAAPALIVILTLLTATAWALWRRHWLGFVGVWFFLILAPTSSIVPIADLAVEHRMYLPLISIIVLAAAGTQWTATTLHRNQGSPTAPVTLAIAATLLTALPLGALTVARNTDYTDAALLWRQTIQTAPNNPRAYYQLAYILDQRGQPRAAIAAYNQALDRNPRYADAHNNLGNIWLGLGDTDQALAHLKTALDIDDSDSQYHYNYAKALMQAGDDQQAEQYIQRALKLAPDHPKSYINQGVILLSRGQTDQALELFRHALTLDEQQPEAHYNLGTALMHQRKAEPAIHHLTRALELNPNDSRVMTNLGLAISLTGRHREALPLFERAARLAPTDPMVQANLATASTSLGLYDKAIAAYRTSLELNPNDHAVMSRLAWLLATAPDARHRDAPEALRLARTAFDAQPDPAGSHYQTLAAAQAESGDFDAAIQTIEAGVLNARANNDPRSADLLAASLTRLRARQPIRLPAPPTQ